MVLETPAEGTYQTRSNNKKGREGLQCLPRQLEEESQSQCLSRKLAS